MKEGRLAFIDGLSGSLSGKRGGVEGLRGEWKRVLDTLKKGDGKVILVLDQMDFLLASSGAEGIGKEMEDLIMEFREVCSDARFLKQRFVNGL